MIINPLSDTFSSIAIPDTHTNRPKSRKNADVSDFRAHLRFLHFLFRNDSLKVLLLILYTGISTPPVTPALSPHSAGRLHVHLIPAPVPEPQFQIPAPDRSP